MRTLLTCVTLVLLAACVPEYDPLADAATDIVVDASSCDALPENYGPLNPWVRESVTGYDHRAGVGEDQGVIHHEAFLVRRPLSNTMLSFQDYLGPDRDRSPATEYDLADQFCDRWCCDECDLPGLSCEEPPCCDEPLCCASPRCDLTEDWQFQECDLCVLFLMQCPYESMGGCERQFLAVSGTVTFDAFQKTDGDWSKDTLDALAVSMNGLTFREVVIDPTTFLSPEACPSQSCTPTESEEDGCFLIEGYSFDYTASE